ncbi:MAG: DUF805 domain-containing protein [Leptospirales bacterium]
MPDPRKAESEDDRFAPREFGDRFRRFKKEAGAAPERNASYEAEQDRPSQTAEPRPLDSEGGGRRRAESRSAQRNSVSPGDAFLNFWKSLFSAHGRATRRRYWTVYLAGSFLLLIQFALISFASTDPEGAFEEAERFALFENTATLVAILLALVYVWVYVATTVRRYHDRGKPGVWVLLLCIPPGGLFVLIECGFMPGTPGANKFGPDPRNATTGN